MKTPATTYGALVGRVLMELRSQKGLMQADMAKALGITQPTWSRAERDASHLTLRVLTQAAVVLDEDGPGSILAVARVASENGGIKVLWSNDAITDQHALVADSVLQHMVLHALVLSRCASSGKSSP